jgi:molybdopterin molybdotransferase
MPETTLSQQSPDASRACMLAYIRPLDSEMIALVDGVGRTLGQDVVATFDQPPFSASSMDGYALTSASEPARLEIVGVSSAGVGNDVVLLPHQAIRIFTGAPLPAGADCVVIQEDVTLDGVFVTVPSIKRGDNVRPQGQDFTSGQTLLRKGRVIDPIVAALISATGQGQITVSKRPRIAILSGGDEIVMPGQARGVHQIYDSITIALTALIEIWGGIACVHQPIRDELGPLQAGLAHAFEGADLIVTIGGASVGDKDLMKPALSIFDPTFLVDKIAVRPGKPTWFAMTARGSVLGLPGNPASALVCAHLFLRPIIAAFSGQTITQTPAFQMAKLASPLPRNGPREHYLRASCNLDAQGQMWVRPAEQQDSALLSIFASATCLIRQMPNDAQSDTGSLVEFMAL